jgi:hypothetical protein
VQPGLRCPSDASVSQPPLATASRATRDSINLGPFDNKVYCALRRRGAVRDQGFPTAWEDSSPVYDRRQQLDAGQAWYASVSKVLAARTLSAPDTAAPGSTVAGRLTPAFVLHRHEGHDVTRVATGTQEPRHDPHRLIDVVQERLAA